MAPGATGSCWRSSPTPTHPEHAERQEWLGRPHDAETFDPGDFEDNLRNQHHSPPSTTGRRVGVGGALLVGALQVLRESVGPRSELIEVVRNGVVDDLSVDVGVAVGDPVAHARDRRPVDPTCGRGWTIEEMLSIAADSRMHTASRTVSSARSLRCMCTRRIPARARGRFRGAQRRSGSHRRRVPRRRADVSLQRARRHEVDPDAEDLAQFRLTRDTPTCTRGTTPEPRSCCMKSATRSPTLRQCGHWGSACRSTTRVLHGPRLQRARHPRCRGGRRH